MAIALDLKPLGRWTDETFVALCRANPEFNFELTATGELIIVSPVGASSGRNEFRVAGQLWDWDRDEVKGAAFSSQTMFCLSNGAKRMPDAAWIRRERWEALELKQLDGFVPISPYFAIEVRSPSDELQPLQEKMREYIDCGVQLAWLIDPQTRRVEIYRANGTVEILDEPEQISGENVLPEFLFSTARIF
ncbi:MAG: Uma2 family endonuclease [Cyanobacteria bacterium P01_D01_bin.123]